MKRPCMMPVSFLKAMAKRALRIAATADLHYAKHSRGKMQEAFAEISQSADVLLLCGDLTEYGLAEEAEELGTKIANGKATAPTRPHPHTPSSPGVLKTAGPAVAAADRAMDAMTGVQSTVFSPDPQSRAVYDRLYALYRQVHDAFGVQGANADLYHVMKTLLDVRDEVRRVA